jgi:DNA-binding beta-propeller fold protein YncE
MRRAKGLGRIVRGDLATRGGSGDSNGSGAPSHRGRLALLSLSALAIAGLVLLVASAFASKEVVNYIGGSSSGSKGGEFWGPGDSAVNSTGAGPANAGDIYVADEYNNRVQRFDEDGNFISAWGADVIQAGKPGDVAGTNPFEICTTSTDCKQGAESGGNGAISGNGALNRPKSLAIDGDTGNVYVADRRNNRVNEYTGDGTFIRSFGFGVDETTAGES